jgi:hypothetical protein
MMSKYYGTLESDKGRTTRAGHKYIDASARTYDGSVTVTIRDGIVTLQVSDGSAVGGNVIYSGKLSDLLNAQLMLRPTDS